MDHERKAHKQEMNKERNLGLMAWIKKNKEMYYECQYDYYTLEFKWSECKKL